jgi:hypothetical protein
MSKTKPLTVVDEVAVKTLIRHQREDIGGCLCGWGVDSGHLGELHPLHVWRELQAAGVAPIDWAELYAERDRLRVAVDAALALHRPLPLDGLCRICAEEPCTTVRALAPVADPDPHTTSDEETT